MSGANQVGLWSEFRMAVALTFLGWFVWALPEDHPDARTYVRGLLPVLRRIAARERYAEPRSSDALD